MRLSTTLVPLGLLLGTGLAIAAPSVRKPAPCLPATAEMCKKAGYIDSKCGQENRATCEPVLSKALEDQHARSKVPEFPGLRPQTTDIPGELRPTKYHAYPGPKKSKGLTTPGTNMLARTRVAQLPVARGVAVSAATAATAHRNKAWDDNGESIGSCAEYAYESVYDWARFVDSAAACRGDADCVFDVAYMKATPGIADRTLRRRDGKAFEKQLPIVKSGKRPKNEMFAYAAMFARSGRGGWLASTPEIEAMATALNSGKAWYGFGCKPKDPTCNKGRSFGDEWDFHRVMRTRNSAVTHAEHAEYERRMAELRELIALHAAAVATEERISIDKATAPRPGPAFDDLISDPFDRLDTMTGFAAKLVAIRPKLLKNMSAIERSNLRKAGVEGLPGLQGRRSAPPVAGLLAMPAPGGALPVVAPPVVPPKLPVIPCAAKNFAEVHESIGVGPISCRIGELLREEWRRKARGQKSCLDLDHDDCDWSPQMFSARFVSDPPYTEEQDKIEKECAYFTGDKFTVPRKNLTEVADYIAKMRTAIGEARQKLEPHKKIVAVGGEKHLTYQKRYEDEEVMGDKDWFAGGYSYDLGWSLEVLPNKDKTDVCQVVGRGDAKATIDAWVGDEHIAVADGGIDAVVNEDGKQKGRAITWLLVLGVAIEERREHEFSQVFTASPIRFRQQIPPQKPSFVAMAGPVPITGSVWGALSYGVDFRFEGRSISKNCSIDDLEFGLETTFTPWLRADGFAQAGVGISGFASVGIRGMLNLITIRLPVIVDVVLLMKEISDEPKLHLGFDVTMDLLLGTLSGSLSLYFEVLGFDEEVELFRWKGIGPTGFPLINPPLHADMPLLGLKTDMPPKENP